MVLLQPAHATYYCLAIVPVKSVSLPNNNKRGTVHFSYSEIGGVYRPIHERGDPQCTSDVRVSSSPLFLYTTLLLLLL